VNTAPVLKLVPLERLSYVKHNKAFLEKDSEDGGEVVIVTGACPVREAVRCEEQQG